MISTYISRASAAFLALAALVLIFASDALLPRVIPSFPSDGVWLGQVLGAAYFAIATLNWLNRSVLMGGVYSRALVLTNATNYFIAALVLVKIVRSDAVAAMWVLFAPIALFACLYVWLLFRGPFERDLAIQRQTNT